MSPLVWDLGHIAAYEDLWLAHRHGGLELLRPELARPLRRLRDAARGARRDRALDPEQARDVHARGARAHAPRCSPSAGVGDGVICEMVLRHELQHSETMRQTMAIAGLLPAGEPALAPLTARATAGCAIPAGELRDGRAGGTGFAYDNERPRHTVELAAFSIARRPVSNASWMHFSEGGGYERREWWSDEGWAWKEEYDITHHPAVAAGHPEAPVCHVSWFEADAFARAHDARLPTEAEWERAATWTQGTAARLGGGRARVGVDRDPLRRLPGLRAPTPTASTPRSSSASDYRVLRGGSWATHPRVASTHVPQLGPAPAAPDLRRRAPGKGGVMEPRQPDQRSRRSDPDRLATSTAPRSARSPRTCSTASRARSRSCRRSTSTTRAAPSCSTASASCPSTTRRAPSARSSRNAPRSWRELTGAVELVELGSGTAAKTRVLLDALHAAGTLERYVPVDVTESMVRELRRGAHRRVPGAAGARRDRRLRAPPRPACRPRSGPRIVAFLGGTIGNFPPGSRRRFLREIAGLLGPEDHLLMGTDLVKDPQRAARPPTTTPRASRPSSTATCCACSTASCGADFDPEDFDHVALFDTEHEWIEMRLRARRELTAHVAALDLAVHFDAGEELRTEISAKFTPERLEGDLAAAGLELVRWLTDPEEPVRADALRAPAAVGSAAMQIEGAAAIVVGGASGLGEATVRALHARGALVTIADVNAEKGEALAAELGLEFVACDVREEDQVQAAVEQRRRGRRRRCASRSAAPAPAGRRRSPARRAPTRCCRSRRSSRST